MSSGDDWDASDNEVTSPAPAAAAPAVRKSKFADEDVEDDGVVKESWEDSDDDEAAAAASKQPSGPAPPVRQKGITKAKIAEKEAAEAAKLEAAMERSRESPMERKKRELAQQMQADLDAAASLFGDSSISKNGSSLSSDSPLEAGGPNPKTTKEFEALAAGLSAFLVDAHGSKPLYSTFVDSFVKALCLPLKDLEVKKVASTLSVLGNEKQRQTKELQAGGKKKTGPGGKGKPQLGTVSGGGGGAKNAVMSGGRGYAADLDAHDEALDDEFDDFM